MDSRSTFPIKIRGDDRLLLGLCGQASGFSTKRTYFLMLSGRNARTTSKRLGASYHIYFELPIRELEAIGTARHRLRVQNFLTVSSIWQRSQLMDDKQVVVFFVDAAVHQQHH